MKPEHIDPFFSIVIPAYNRADRIKDAVSSCLSQTFESYEIIVVDDGSTDNTSEVVNAFESSRITCIKQKNAGASAARNHGALNAKGQYIAFLDSDDAFLPDKLARFYQAIIHDPAPDPVIWYSPLFFHRGAGNRLIKPSRTIGKDESVGDYLFAADGLMQTSTLVIPADLFRSVGFDESLRCLEDLDLCLRLEEAGATFSMLPDPLVIWSDECQTGRLSYTTSADEIRDWLERQSARLSPRATNGFAARFLAPIILRRHPVQAATLLARAIRDLSLSPKRAAMLVARGAAPQSYGRLRDLIVRRRHE